jgi:hypothetical protein
MHINFENFLSRKHYYKFTIRQRNLRGNSIGVNGAVVSATTSTILEKES